MENNNEDGAMPEEPTKLDKDEIIIELKEAAVITHSIANKFQLYTKIHHTVLKSEELKPYSSTLLKKIKEKFSSSVVSVDKGVRFNQEDLAIYMICEHAMKAHASIPLSEFGPNKSLKFKIKSECSHCFPSKNDINSYFYQ